jgi:putative restriction endonuclease
MMRRRWTRNETLVALNVYCRNPFGRLHARNPEIIEVASALGRTPDALAMKCCNLASFDPALAIRGIVGLGKASQIDREVWEEFASDPDSTAFAAECEYAALMNRELRTAPEVEWKDVEGLDRTAATKVRVNQHFFRSMILSSYRSECAVCELPFASLLVASHIVPWAIDKLHRMNPQNGLCLCVLHDRAFDRGLLIIRADYQISIHDDLRATSHNSAVADNFLRFHGSKLKLPERWLPDPALLDRHVGLPSRA